MSASRPLRAITVVLAGWVAMRIAWQLPGAEPPPAGVAPAAVAQTRTAVPRAIVLEPASGSFRKASTKAVVMRAIARSHAEPESSRRIEPTVFIQSASGTSPHVGATQIALPPVAPLSVPHRRLSGSFWLIARDDGAIALARGGQLGGGQAGARIFFAPGPDALVMTARVSAPLRGPGAEASVGAGIRGRIGGVLLERRIALDRGGRDAVAVTGYAGIYDRRVTRTLTASAWAQAGIVGARSRDAFVDGAASIEYGLIEHSGSRLTGGAIVVAAAQPGAQRVDVGPLFTIRTQLDSATARLSGGWRFRVAGAARPASGPAVSLGLDF